MTNTRRPIHGSYNVWRQGRGDQTHLFFERKLAFMPCGQSRRILTAVLNGLKPNHNRRCRIFDTDKSNESTHGLPLMCWVTTIPPLALRGR